MCWACVYRNKLTLKTTVNGMVGWVRIWKGQRTRYGCYLSGYFLGNRPSLIEAKELVAAALSEGTMSRMYEDRNKPVATWLTQPELELFRAIARANNVTPAAYLRAMIVDVLAEEGNRVSVAPRLSKPDIFALLKQTEAIR